MVWYGGDDDEGDNHAARAGNCTYLYSCPGIPPLPVWPAARWGPGVVGMSDCQSGG